MPRFASDTAIADLPDKTRESLLGFLAVSDRGVSSTDTTVELLHTSIALKAIGRRTS